jgi:anion-transporting  ArsA/GET3 family ATPase
VTPERSLAALVANRSILVCCGSGGVGKTTTAAGLALAAAKAGRTACVVTIDPAKRLADALGVAELSNDPTPIEGPWSGQLFAVMLDAKRTFDDLVARYASDDAQRSRILSNRLYRNLTSALSGTQEYMAMEKLYELHEGGRFDLIVVDTPPTRHALDFLEAPRRLTNFLDNRIFRLLLAPARSYLRALSIATKTLLRTLSRVAGAEFVDDAVAFFQAFEGMEGGFRERAAKVELLLGDGGTGFVLVAAPRRDAIEEAAYFGERLRQSDLEVSALVVNRVHPAFLGGAGAGRDRSRSARSGTGAAKQAPSPATERLLEENLEQFRLVARREDGYVADLAAAVDPAPVVRVPLMSSDVHDLAGLSIVTGYLLAEQVAFAGGQDHAGQ